MKTISVYSQKDLDEIKREFDGRINIYGGDYCNPIIVRGAWNNSTVEAWSSCTVKARGNSTVKACDNSSVEALDNSTIVACENSYVEARDHSHVEARGKSSVNLNGYAQARIYSDDVNYKTSGYARVILPFDEIDSYINYFGI
jgi:hypothetical protein